MNALTEKVMASCNLSEQEAERELRNETEVLMHTHNPMEFCESLGLDEDDIFSNPEAILAFI